MRRLPPLEFGPVFFFFFVKNEFNPCGFDLAPAVSCAGLALWVSCAGLAKGVSSA